MSDIDSLVIDINAKSQKANDAIDRLVGKLDRLSTSLTKINGTNLSGLANGVHKLGTAMQTMNNVKTTDFTRLATNLTKLGNVNTQALNTMASSMSHLTRAFNNLGTVSSNAQQVGELANNLSQLGSARMQRAIVNIPQLATAMSNLMATLSTAPRVSRNVIDMANAMANLSAQGSRVGTASRHMVSGLNRTSTSANRASKSYKGLAASIGKFYATYFMVIRGLKGLWQSIESTADYIEAYNYFNVALGKIGSDWSEQFEQYGYENAEAYAESFADRLSESLRDLSGVEIQIGADGKGILSATGMKNLGLNIQEVTQYASQLASVTNSVGQTGEVSLAAAESLTKLGADISSLFNIDFSQAMTNLQSGLIGQSRALYKYGIDITNATLQTYAYELGIEKAVSEMTQAEKMQLRMIAILDQSKVAWGDLANTISSPSNMMRQFTNNLKETGMVLGQLFVPLLQKVLPVINGATIALKRLLVNIAGFLGIKLDLESFGQGYNKLEDDIGGAADTMDDLTDSAKKAKGMLRGFDELKVINTSDSSTIKGLEDTIDLTDEILAATSEYEKVWDEAFNKMENKAEKFADIIEKYLAPVQDLFKNLFAGDFAAAGWNVSNLVIGLNTFLANAIDSVDWEKVGDNIGDFLANIDWEGILSSIGKLIWSGINAGMEQWSAMFNAAPIETTIISSIALLKWIGLDKAIAASMLKALANGITLSDLKLNVSSFIGLGTNPAFLEVGNNILDKISDAMESLIPDWAFDLLSKIGAGLVGGAAVGSWFPGAGTIAGAIIGAIVGAFSTVKINGQSVLKNIIDTLFNFDETEAIFEDVKKQFEKGGINIVLGIAEGIVGAFGFFVEPIKDLFEAIWGGICKIFGIHSPAESMKPIGANIVLGIKEGFVSAFKELENAAKALWDTFATWFNNLLTFEIEPIELFGKQVFGGATIDLGKIPTFGGSKKYEATKPASIGSYQTSYTGIYKQVSTPNLNNGVLSSLESTLKQMISQNQNANTNVNVTLAGDAGDIFRVVQNSANDYQNRTGNPAFGY